MLDMLMKRRTCRKFENKAVEVEKKEKLLQAAQFSPTGKNNRPWEFIIIENKETLQKLGNCRHPNQPFLPNTPLAIVVLGDTNKTDTWVEDVSVASIIIQLEAESLGLGSFWVQIRLRESNQGMSSEDYLRQILNIPRHMGVVCIVALGYPEKKLPAYTLDKVDRSKIHIEHY